MCMTKKGKKLLIIIVSKDIFWLRALRYGVAASVEHTSLLRNLECQTVVDIGANRGQFALAVRHYLPNAQIYAFEPLPKPSADFKRVFVNDSQVELYSAAIGSETKQCTMHCEHCHGRNSILHYHFSDTYVFFDMDFLFSFIYIRVSESLDGIIFLLSVCLFFMQ